jgi:hypothetical protein
MQAQATMPRDSPETALRTDEHRQKTLQAGRVRGKNTGETTSPRLLQPRVFGERLFRLVRYLDENR